VTASLSTISSIKPTEIIDCEMSGLGDENKYQANSIPCSNPQEEAAVISKQLSIQLNRAVQLKREQMVKNDKYQRVQFGIEERKFGIEERRLNY